MPYNYLEVQYPKLLDFSLFKADFTSLNSSLKKFCNIYGVLLEMKWLEFYLPRRLEMLHGRLLFKTYSPMKSTWDSVSGKVTVLVINVKLILLVLFKQLILLNLLGIHKKNPKTQFCQLYTLNLGDCNFLIRTEVLRLVYLRSWPHGCNIKSDVKFVNCHRSRTASGFKKF